MDEEKVEPWDWRTYAYGWWYEQVKAVVAVDLEVLDRYLDPALLESLLLEEQGCDRSWDDAHLLGRARNTLHRVRLAGPGDPVREDGAAHPLVHLVQHRYDVVCEHLELG